jgi:hypothetical protein
VRERTQVDFEPFRQFLGAVRDQVGRGANRDRLDLLAYVRVAQQVGLDVGDVVGRGRECQRRQRAATGRAGPPGFDRDARRGAGFLGGDERGLRVARDRPFDLERFHRFGRDRAAAVLREGVEDPREQGAELELVEQDAHALGVERAVLEILGLDLDVDVSVEHRHLAVLQHAILSLAEVLALLRRQLVEMVEDALQRAIGADELRGGLLADPWHAGQVVAGVAAQRGVLGVLRRGHAAAFEDAGLVVERVVGDTATVVEDLDVRVGDELIGVAVAGDDDHVDPVGRRVGRERGDHVVGLDPGDLQLADLEGLEHLVDQRQLRGEEVGGLLAPGLVLRVELVAVRAPAGRVEHHREVVGLLVGAHLGEHRREAVDRVRDRARLRREVGRQGKERAVGQRQAVEQEQLRHLGRSYAGGATPAVATLSPGIGVRGRACPRPRRGRLRGSCDASPSRPSGGSAKKLPPTASARP